MTRKRVKFCKDEFWKMKFCNFNIHRFHNCSSKTFVLKVMFLTFLLLVAIYYHKKGKSLKTNNGSKIEKKSYFSLYFIELNEFLSDRNAFIAVNLGLFFSIRSFRKFFFAFWKKIVQMFFFLGFFNRFLARRKCEPRTLFKVYNLLS